MSELIRYIKGLEKEFLKDNTELYQNNRIEFLRKRDVFVSEKLIERKNGSQE